MGVAQVVLSLRLSPTKCRSGLQGDEPAAGSHDAGQMVPEATRVGAVAYSRLLPFGSVLKAVVVMTVAGRADLWVPALIDGSSTLLATANGLRPRRRAV